VCQLLNFGPGSEASPKAKLTRESQRYLTFAAFDTLDMVVATVLDRAVVRP
jgi:hypothetical protein